jgi:hypothetical protein
MYLPELYPWRMRSTAFGFSYNTGRFLAAFAVSGSGALIGAFSGSHAIAASAVASVYVFEVVAAYSMPKTKGEIAQDRCDVPGIWCWVSLPGIRPQIHVNLWPNPPHGLWFSLWIRFQTQSDRIQTWFQTDVDSGFPSRFEPGDINLI